MTVSAEEAINIYFMADFVKRALLFTPAEMVENATKLQARVLKAYPELKAHLEK